MSDNMNKFLKEIAQNDELKTKIEAIASDLGGDAIQAKIIEIAKSFGFELTPEDLGSVISGLLDDELLDDVAGGKPLDRKFLSQELKNLLSNTEEAKAKPKKKLITRWTPFS